MKTVADTDNMPGLAALIAERQRLGLDGHDEMWEGVYHVAPMARADHGDIQIQLALALSALAADHGLIVSGPVNIGADEQDHRVPDLVVLRERTRLVWVPTAAMVVEVRSPGDETYDKFGFYHSRDVEEILVADLDLRSLSLHVRHPVRYEPSDHSLLLHTDLARIASEITWPS